MCKLDVSCTPEARLEAQGEGLCEALLPSLQQLHARWCSAARGGVGRRMPCAWMTLRSGGAGQSAFFRKHRKLSELRQALSQSSRTWQAGQVGSVETTRGWDSIIDQEGSRVAGCVGANGTQHARTCAASSQAKVVPVGG
jgi:hypothetical protein